MFIPNNNQDITLDPEPLNNFLLLDSVVEILNNIAHTDTHFYDIVDERPIPPEPFIGKKLAQKKYLISFQSFPIQKVWIFIFYLNYVVKMTMDTIKEPLSFILCKCLD